MLKWCRLFLKRSDDVLYAFCLFYNSISKFHEIVSIFWLFFLIADFVFKRYKLPFLSENIIFNRYKLICFIGLEFMLCAQKNYEFVCVSLMLFFGITILFMWLANFLGASIRVRLGCRVVCLACVAVTIFQLIINFSFAEFLKNIKSIDSSLSEFLVNVLQFFH